MLTRSSRFLCKLLSVCLCVVVCVWLCMCVWLCVCVWLCERERERERERENLHSKFTTQAQKFLFVFFFSRGKGRGLFLVSSAASSTSYNGRQFVINIYSIHAADRSEKWSLWPKTSLLWLHGYGKFDVLKLTRICWLRSQLVKSDHCHWKLDRCGALVSLIEHRRPNVAYRYIHSAIFLLLWSVEIVKFYVLNFAVDSRSSSFLSLKVFRLRSSFAVR